MEGTLMRILVTGGAGYIGSHVVLELCEEHEVIVLDNLSAGSVKNVDKRATFVKGDILNPKDLDKVFAKKIDCVFHFAALKAAGESMKIPEEYARVNISGTINVLNAMVKYDVKKIIFSSSAAVYGTPKYVPVDENHGTDPTNFYGFTKLQIEAVLEWYLKLKGIHYAALRYFNAAGYDPKGRIRGKEKNPGNLVPILMEVVRGERKILDVFGNDYKTKDGTGVRDYVHVTDLADGHLKAMVYLEDHEKIIVNLGGGQGYSVLEIIQATEKIIGKKIPYQIVERRPGDPDKLIASYQKAKKLLNWTPKLSDLNSIIRTATVVLKE
jgi:UDP-glucose 4-epimerase